MTHPRVRFGPHNTIREFVPEHKTFNKPVRLRTPDHLPMDHSPSQSRQQAMQQRQRRVTTAQNVRKACMDSGSLRQYSKKRFEFAVQNVSLDLDRGRVLPRPATTPAFSSPWTGPTSTGSLLYNRVPLMLNSIRVRPNSETAKYDHIERTYPDIERTLQQSNAEFRVRSLNPGGSMMSSRANSLMSRGYSQAHRENSLVSRGNSMTQKANLMTSRGHTMTSCGQYPLSRGTTPRSVTSEFVLVPVGERSEFYNEVTEFLRPETEEGWYADRWNPLTPRPQVVLEMTEHRGHDVMSESCSSESTLPGSRPLTQDRKTQQISRRTIDVTSSNRLGVSGLGRPLTGSRRTGSELSLSGSLSSTASSRSERPKCWVDDVTISSEMTEEGEDNGDVTMEDNKQKLDSNINLDKTKSKSKTDTKQVKIEEKVEEEVPMEEAEKVEEVIQEEEEEELIESPRIEFPHFLCPSSERKSRQAAIKMWLANTSFTCADRSVPLL